MVKKIIVIFILLLFPNYIFAADVIHLKDGTKFEGKVITIQPETVEIDMGENKPKRIIAKKDIKVIVYENGEVETFEIKKEEVSTSQDINEIKKKVEEKEKKDTKKEGLITGIAICCILYIIVALIVASNSSAY